MKEDSPENDPANNTQQEQSPIKKFLTRQTKQTRLIILVSAGWLGTCIRLLIFKMGIDKGGVVWEC